MIKNNVLEKVNGLDSSTRFYDYYEKNGDRIEYHKHPQTDELVIIRSWFVPNGEDDVDQDFKVESVYPRVGCMLAMYNYATDRFYKEF